MTLDANVSMQSIYPIFCEIMEIIDWRMVKTYKFIIFSLMSKFSL